MSRLLFISYDQLSLSSGVMLNADPSSDEIVMIESHSMLTSRTWQASRIHLLMSAAAHHAVAMERLASPSTVSKLTRLPLAFASFVSLMPRWRFGRRNRGRVHCRPVSNVLEFNSYRTIRF